MMAVNGLRPPMIPWPAKPPSRAALHQNRTALALAQTTTQIGRVTMVRTGWDADSFAVVTTSPLVNPGGCPTPDGYIAFQPQKGYTTYYAAALLAFELNVRVQVTVANTGCIAGRPKLIGINLLR
jgi:hypothetical protein